MYFEQAIARGASGEQVTRRREWPHQLGHHAEMIDGAEWRPAEDAEQGATVVETLETMAAGQLSDDGRCSPVWRSLSSPRTPASGAAAKVK